MNTDNLATQVVGDDLGFEGMTFLFAAIEAFLVVLAQLQHLTGWAAFLGRSQGVSVASIRTSS